MKTKIFTLLLALCAACCFQSCDNDDDNTVKVPAELQKTFEAQYPHASDVKWESRNGYYKAEFYDGQKASAWYTTGGDWRLTETDIPRGVLPQAVAAAFNQSEYASAPWQFDEAKKLDRPGFETVYVIEVEQGNKEMDLYYTPAGALIKCVEDVDGDRDDDFLPTTPLTETMKKLLSEKYPKAQIAEVDKVDSGIYKGYTEVDIVDGNQVREVLFDAKGQWVLTATDVLYSAVPEPVKEYISRTHPGKEIDREAEYVEKADGTTYYLIEVEMDNDRDLEVKVSPQGVEIK